MTRPVYIPEFDRAFPAPQRALLDRIKQLYENQCYLQDSSGLLKVPFLDDPQKLAELERYLISNGKPKLRLGRCNWLDPIGMPPVSGSLKEAQSWVSKAIDLINQELGGGIR